MPSEEIPRRIDRQRMNMAELAISEAIAVTETVGADPRLTDAVVLLSAARDSVADYVDGVPIRRGVTIEAAPGPAHRIAQLNQLREALEKASNSLELAVNAIRPIDEPVAGRRPDNMAVAVRVMRRDLAAMTTSVQLQIDKVFNNG